MGTEPSFVFALLIVGMGMLAGILLSYGLDIPVYEEKIRVPASEMNFKRRLNVADDLFSVVFFPIIAYIAVSGSMELLDENTVDARWSESTPSSYWFMYLYVSRMLLHIPVQTILLWDNEKGLLWQMTAHHIFSTVCFANALVVHHMHFWGLLAGCCELTTGPLSILGISLNCFPPDHYYAKIVTAFAGFALWLGFLVFRIALFPVWLWIFHSDIVTYPEQTWAIMSGPERVLYPAVIMLLWGLSVMWMIPITKGLIKALGLNPVIPATERETEKLLPLTRRPSSYASPLITYP